MKMQVSVLLAFVGLVLGTLRIQAETNQVMAASTNLVQKISTNDLQALVRIKKFDPEEALRLELASATTKSFEEKSSLDISKTGYVDADGKMSHNVFSFRKPSWKNLKLEIQEDNVISIGNKIPVDALFVAWTLKRW